MNPWIYWLAFTLLSVVFTMLVVYDGPLWAVGAFAAGTFFSLIDVYLKMDKNERARKETK